MTDQIIEQKFKAFRKTITAIEFNDMEFLTKKAEEMQDTDSALSARILIRVKNIAKEKNKETTLVSNAGNVGNIEDKTSISKSGTPSFIEKAKSHSVVKNITRKVASFKVTSLSPFTTLVLIPVLLFSFYQIFWATERFESQAQVIVQQPDSMATMDPNMALLTGLGVPTGGSDAELVKAYIYSTDMISYLNDKLALRKHYSQNFIDFFSKIHDGDSRETLLEYYQAHIEVSIDEKSGVITIRSQGFESGYAQSLTNAIVKRAEWFINSIGHQLADAQLVFIQGEHELIEKRLAEAQKKLLVFQQKYNLLDPTAEGAAMQKITYTLEGQIAAKQTEIKALKAIMNPYSLQVKGLENELSALNAQLSSERKKLSHSGQQDISVSEILSIFTDYKIKMELALQAYTSSQISLEKSRVEAYRQMKYLIVVEQATLSEDNKYPDVIYNISLFFLLLSMSFAIIKIVISTINELK